MNKKNESQVTESFETSPLEGPWRAFLVITGAAGFIGSCLVSYLNHLGFENLILVDEFDREEKELNLLHKKYAVRVERENFFDWAAREKPSVDFVFHLGARTDTTEFNYAVHQHLNVEYSQNIWNYCTINNIPLLYASSAATYGDGELGYEDVHELVELLRPLNPYGISKNEFDKWALHQEDHPPYWAGLKFFNVYGPNEYHKGRMASMVFHTFNQVSQKGRVKLFRSHKTGYKDGEQIRDFIYVKDILAVCYWIMEKTAGHKKQVPGNAGIAPPAIPCGLYNLGSGIARSFNDLAMAGFTAMGFPALIDYIDIPEDIRDKYQYSTVAKMDKLKLAGYANKFYSLEEGVEDYVRNYLSKNSFY